MMNKMNSFPHLVNFQGSNLSADRRPRAYRWDTPLPETEASKKISDEISRLSKSHYRRHMERSERRIEQDLIANLVIGIPYGYHLSVAIQHISSDEPDALTPVRGGW